MLEGGVGGVGRTGNLCGHEEIDLAQPEKERKEKGRL